MKNLNHYLDKYGTPFHLKDDLTSPEYGDGMARFSSMYLCQYFTAPTSIDASIIAGDFKVKQTLFFLESGEPVRHTEPYGANEWWSRPGNCSGDQIEPYLCACLVMGHKDLFWSMIWKLTKRGFFAWNTKKIGQQDEAKKIPDFVGIRLLGLILRACYNIPILGYFFYPIITLWDLALLPLTTLVRCIVPLFDRDNTGDDLNFFHKFIAYFKVAPNPVSWACRNIYMGLRPLSGTPEYRKAHKGFLGCTTAFENYYMDIKAPPLDVLLIKAALKL